MRRYSVTASLRGDYCFRFEVIHVLPLPLVPVHACMIPHLEGHTATERSSYDKSLWLCFDSFMPASMLFLGLLTVDQWWSSEPFSLHQFVLLFLGRMMVASCLFC
jgi:hypothetical protein